MADIEKQLTKARLYSLYRQGRILILPERTNIMSKQWYKSKTLWIGILEFVGGILVAISGQLAAGGVMTIDGIIKVVLRVLTDSKIEFSRSTLN